jgi:mannose/fructose/N-acetylgalactosamine-specific phosphotransferase system component IID
MRKNDVSVQSEETSVISKRDHFFAWLRYTLFLNTSSSFDRLYGIGFANAIAPLLKKLYPKREKLVAALERQSSTFITEPTYGAVIPGAVVAMEEAKSKGEEIPDELIVGFKTGLMGPIAGFGDSLNWATIMPLMRALFLPLGYAGSVFGFIGEWFVWWVYCPIVSYNMYKLGYKKGRESVFSVLEKGTIQNVLVIASVLGMFMMGVMASSYVSLTTPLVFTMNGVDVTLQSSIDNILPGLLPFLVMVGTYLFLSKKGNYIKLLVGFIAISLLGSWAGIF